MKLDEGLPVLRGRIDLTKQHLQQQMTVKLGGEDLVDSYIRIKEAHHHFKLVTYNSQLLPFLKTEATTSWMLV
jgi:hypothetical protein